MTVLIIGNWSLFDIWCLVLGSSSLCRYLEVDYQGGGGNYQAPKVRLISLRRSEMGTP